MLYQGGRVKKILVSGNETAEAPEVTAMTAWLLERGVAAKDILTDTGGSRTRETMNRAADVFDVHDAVICTQDVNVDRSVYLAGRPASTPWRSARRARSARPRATCGERP